MKSRRRNPSGISSSAWADSASPNTSSAMRNGDCSRRNSSMPTPLDIPPANLRHRRLLAGDRARAGQTHSGFPPAFHGRNPRRRTCPDQHVSAVRSLRSKRYWRDLLPLASSGGQGGPSSSTTAIPAASAWLRGDMKSSRPCSKRPESWSRRAPARKAARHAFTRPSAGSGNKPLDKKAAATTLSYLLGEMDFSESSVEPGPDIPASEDEIPVEPEQEPVFRIGFFDLETQRLAAEVGGWQNKHLMRVSVAVLYESPSERFKVYREDDVSKLIRDLTELDLVVGFQRLPLRLRSPQGLHALRFLPASHP